MPDAISPRGIADSLADHWSPRIIAEVDDSFVKVAKLQGTFGWHNHAHEDELFLVLKGRLHIEMEERSVDLAEGELFVVPKGVRHNPSAQEECLVMLVERKSTLHTGDIVNEKTRSLAQQRGPV